MADTDAAGVIYFGAPTRWADTLTGDWLVSRSVGHAFWLTRGIHLPAVHAELHYRQPLRLDDRLDARLWLERFDGSSFTLRSDFHAQDSSLAAVSVSVTQVRLLVSEDGERRRGPLPDELMTVLTGA